jgi:hypothetical protein
MASQEQWVRLNKCTETAIGYDDSENGRFLCSSSSKKGIDRKPVFLAEENRMSLFLLNVDDLGLSDSHAEHWLCSLPAPGGLCTK